MRTSGISAWFMPKVTPSEQPKSPSWMAPAAVEAAATSWAAPPPPSQRRSTEAPRSTSYSRLPKISVPPEAEAPDISGMPLVPQAPPGPDPLAVLGPVVDEVRAGLEDARKSVEAARREALATTEKDLVRLAIAIAERVIGREIAGDPALVARWAREGLEALGADDTVKVHVAPRVAVAMKELEDWFGPGHSPEIVVDDRLDDHACEVRGRWGRVDAGVHARLDAVVASLGVSRDVDAEDDEEGAP